MQELIDFAHWLHDHYVPWGEREEKLFLPLCSPDGDANTAEEIVLEYYKTVQHA